MLYVLNQDVLEVRPPNHQPKPNPNPQGLHPISPAQGNPHPRGLHLAPAQGGFINNLATSLTVSGFQARLRFEYKNMQEKTTISCAGTPHGLNLESLVRCLYTKTNQCGVPINNAHCYQCQGPRISPGTYCPQSVVTFPSAETSPPIAPDIALS